jgi:hypothetical protein
VEELKYNTYVKSEYIIKVRRTFCHRFQDDTVQNGGTIHEIINKLIKMEALMVTK